MAAGIDRDEAYLTNVVKHFKWEARGKRRLHRKPGAREIRACSPWLTAELELIAPEVLVCLGATAAHALIRGDFPVTRERDRFVRSARAPYVMATIHPSAILRMPRREARDRARETFVADLRLAGRSLASRGP